MLFRSHRNHLNMLELCAQLGQRQLVRLARRVSADLDHVLVAVDRGWNPGVVVTHEERIVRRDQAVVEDLERRFELGGREVNTISGRFSG